jgi:hypothetical protein
MEQKNSPFHRFRPVTVRAAARLAAMAALGRITPEETAYYMRALAASEAGAGPGAHRGLLRVARRRAAFGNTGVLCAARTRAARLQLDELPECLRSVLIRTPAA